MQECTSIIPAFLNSGILLLPFELWSLSAVALELWSFVPWPLNCGAYSRPAAPG